MPATIRLVPLSLAALQALADGDLALASAEVGVALSPYLVSDDCTWLWRLRLDDIARRSEALEWVARPAMDTATGQVVGHAGFHGPPDESGMVEVAYSTDPEHRRRGHARAMLAALLQRAAREPSVRVVRASISPDNAASLATIRGFGFAQVGEQWDDEDGLELLFERPARVPPGCDRSR